MRTFRSVGLAVALVSLAAGQAFAIGGLGVHYTMNTGHLKAQPSNPLTYSTDLSFDVNQEKTSTLRGIGFKAWFDMLPIVDIEATWNMQFASYPATLTATYKNESKVIPLKIGFEVPGYSAQANPVFANMNLDISALATLDLLPIITPYIGGGFTWMMHTPVINSAFLDKALTGEDGDDVYRALERYFKATEPGPQKTALKELFEELSDNTETKSGVGGHLVAGLRAKLPIIPLAIYANGKYYFGGGLPKGFDNGFVIEVGGGLAL
jgi:hypothetical protein